METESARMSSASEAKFRIGGPNSLPRSIKIIALDPNSERVLARIGAEKWEGASFLTAKAFSGSPAMRGDFSLQGWLSDLAGRARDLVNEVQGADSVVMVSTAGESAEAAGLIGEACSLRHVLSTALILGGRTCSDETLSKSLSQLRPHVAMLVVSGEDEYIKDMLTALRA
jgi:hypothetical protein